MADAQHSGGEEPPSPRALIGLGIEMAVAILLFMLVGNRLDRWLATGPWLFLVGALLGVAIAFYSFFRRVMPLRDDSRGREP